MKELKFIIYGKPITKKNSQQIFRTKLGRPFITQSRNYKEYEEMALVQLLNIKERYGERIEVSCLYFVGDRRKRDLTNLLAATHDILQKAEIIKDDALIYSVDGSRIQAIDKKNPRTEITIITEN